MRKVRAVIVDDESIARERVRRLLAKEPGVEIVGEAGSGQQAIEAIDRSRPDVVFLDVQMPGYDGFQVLRALTPPRPPAIVFVTAYDQYALRAFEVHALDYLLKPFDAHRLRVALGRARTQVTRSVEQPGVYERKLVALIERLTEERAQVAAMLNDVRPRYPDRVTVRSDGRVTFVRLADVEWIESAHNHVMLHAGGKSHRYAATLSELEAQLDPAAFVRIHRFTIVNRDRVREIWPAVSGDQIVILDSGKRVRLSRSRRDALLPASRVAEER